MTNRIRTVKKKLDDAISQLCEVSLDSFLSGFLDPLIWHALITEKEHPKQFPAMDALVFLWLKPWVVPLT